MATVAVKLGSKPHSKTGKLPVRIRLTHHRKPVYETVCYVQKKHFVDGRITSYDPNSKELNKRLADRLREVETLVAAYEKLGREFTGEEIFAVDFPAWLDDKTNTLATPTQQQREYLLVYGRQIAATMRQEGNPQLAGQYERELRMLEGYLVSRLDGMLPKNSQVADVKMEELTGGFFADYFTYLRERPKKPSKKDSTHKRRLAQFMAIVNEAHRTGIIRKVPVVNVNLQVEKSRKRKLTSDAIATLRGYNPDEDTSSRRDSRRLAVHTFLIQYYLYGARVGDVMKLKNRNVICQHGKPVSVHYYQEKGRRRAGKTLMEITVNRNLLPILTQYFQPDKPDDYLLPWVRWQNDPTLSEADNNFQLQEEVHRDTTKMNKALKMAAEEMGLVNDFTSHSSRHTYAQQAKRKGKSVEFIKESLGHSTYDITAGYLEDLDKDELNNALSDVYD